MMKKLFLLPLLLFPLLVGFGACEPDEYCKDCYIVTYLPDGSVEKKDYVGYMCDDELREMEAEDDNVSPQGVRTAYECD